MDLIQIMTRAVFHPTVKNMFTYKYNIDQSHSSEIKS